jgi:hypothetical protein
MKPPGPGQAEVPGSTLHVNVPFITDQRAGAEYLSSPRPQRTLAPELNDRVIALSLISR